MARTDIKFGKPHPERGSWENAWQHAASERAVMVAEFHAWLVKTRIETEKELLNDERRQRELAPFAQAGLDLADTPQELPMVVVEFAHCSLKVLDFKRRLNLLNVYYRQAVQEENDTGLTVEEGNEAEINELWEWFVKERE